MMDDALQWNAPRATERNDVAAPATAHTGGSDDPPVRIAVLMGALMIDLAQQALQDAEIPVLVKRNSANTAYGLATGPLAAAEIWVPRALAEQAEDVLVGIGVV